MKRRFPSVARDALCVGLAVCLLATAGCATRSRVSASNEIATAMFAIRDAKNSGAESYAQDELSRAEELVGQARDASAAEAERLAELATVYAQLAGAKAARQTARRRLAEAESVDVQAERLERRTLKAVEDRVNP